MTVMTYAPIKLYILTRFFFLFFFFAKTNSDSDIPDIIE